MDLAVQRAHLVAQLGEPVGPMEVARFALQRGRCCGKTYEMIKALPDDGNAAIVVLKLEHWYDHFKQQVLIQRPGYPVAMLRIVDYHAAALALRGEPPRPVFVDNTVTDYIALQYVEMLNAPRLPNQVVEEERNWP